MLTDIRLSKAHIYCTSVYVCPYLPNGFYSLVIDVSGISQNFTVNAQERKQWMSNRVMKMEKRHNKVGDLAY